HLFRTYAEESGLARHKMYSLIESIMKNKIVNYYAFRTLNTNKHLLSNISTVDVSASAV
ncbi:29735_t:CDS:2, partial [Racocetra persica]